MKKDSELDMVYFPLQVPGKPGWMLGMLADGTTGIYPRNRVEEVSQGVRVSRV